MLIQKFTGNLNVIINASQIQKEVYGSKQKLNYILHFRYMHTIDEQINIAHLRTYYLNDNMRRLNMNGRLGKYS